MKVTLTMVVLVMTTAIFSQSKDQVSTPNDSRPGGTLGVDAITRGVNEKRKEVEDLWTKMVEAPSVVEFQRYAQEVRTRLVELQTYGDKLPSADEQRIKGLLKAAEENLKACQDEIWSTRGELKSRLGSSPADAEALKEVCRKIKEISSALKSPTLTADDPILKKHFQKEELENCSDVREFARKTLVDCNNELFAKIPGEMVVTVRKLARLANHKTFQHQMISVLNSSMKDAKLLTGLKQEYEEGIKADIENLNQMEQVVQAVSDVKVIRDATLSNYRDFIMPKPIRETASYGEADDEFVRLLSEALSETK